MAMKRIVLVTGDKGGTGKSTFARGVLDCYLARGIACQPYDADRRNAQLYRHYKPAGVRRLDFFTRGGADALLDDLEQHRPQTVLVDLPSQSGEAFENYEADIGLFAQARELGYDTTVALVLSRVADSINALRLTLDYCGDAVDYLAVKNLFFGEPDRFARFDRSQTRERLHQQGGLEISLPDLFDEVYDAIDERNLTFEEAVRGEAFTRSNRSRIYNWRKRLAAELDKAGPLLGLEASGDG